MPKYPLLVEGVPLFRQGKTRDTHLTTDPNKLLVVATDRLSTHNVVHGSTIPWKGVVLTALTIFWAKQMDRWGISHHLVASGKEIKPYLLPGRYPEDILARAIVVEKLDMALVEFIRRAYLAGSLYDKFYKVGKDPYGINLKPGLPLMYRFPEPIFTPTDKSEDDDPIESVKIERGYPVEVALSIQLFDLIRSELNASGIEMVDSKFELGRTATGRVVVADEFGTPDSSRFAYLSDIVEGKPPPWLDKQFFRDEAERMWGTGPKVPLTFHSAIIKKGSTIYQDVLAAVIGMPLPAFDRNYHR